MASDLKSDLVMTAFQRGPNLYSMGNLAVVKIYPCTLEVDRHWARRNKSAEGYVASHVRDRDCTHSSCGYNTKYVSV